MTLPHGVAIHSTDLVEEDRLRVEKALANGEAHLVFATSTLAAGVHFPIGTVIFYSWVRSNPDRRRYEPILPSEFHNMAGRCGRMGTQHQAGRVLFLADDRHNERAVARDFLDPDYTDPLHNQITTTHFISLILHLTASNVVNTTDQALTFLKATFGASRELNANAAGLAHWNGPFEAAVERLREWTFLR